jgi:acyl-CoA reductase-like NAD-dependent aldehyde dehydrogenase
MPESELPIAPAEAGVHVAGPAEAGLYRGIADGDLAALEPSFERVSFPAGTWIFKAGSDSDCCYLITSGQVRIELDGSELDSENVLIVLEAGSILGELGFMDGMPRSAGAVAQTDVEARKILTRDIDRLLTINPTAVAGLYRLLGRNAAQKLRDMNERFADAIFTTRDPEIDDLVERAAAAQHAIEDWSEERIDDVLLTMAQSVAVRARELAEATVRITRVGNVPDKVAKNLMASMGVYRSLAGARASGPLATDDERRVTEIAAPVGVIAGLIPMTNPAATAIFKTLIAIKARNALILSFPRITGELGTMVGTILRDALARAGAPVDLVGWIGRSNSRKKTEILMGHRGVALILATGGASMVKSAYASGTPTIGVGPGNAPVLVCADADLDHAAQSVILSKAFDNGLICGSENNLVVVRGVRERFVEALARTGAAVLDADESRAFLAATVVPGTARFRNNVLGKSAAHLAGAAGITRPYAIRLIVVASESVATAGALAREKMAPILSLFTVEDDRQGIEVSRALLAEEGCGHTAVIHAADPAVVDRFAAAMPVSRILVNTPASHGVIGFTTGLMPSLTLGCGTFGNNSTTDNVSYRNLLNIKRVAHYRP